MAHKHHKMTTQEFLLKCLTIRNKLSKIIIITIENKIIVNLCDKEIKSGLEYKQQQMKQTALNKNKILPNKIFTGTQRRIKYIRKH
jgi:hypothetical protein